MSKKFGTVHGARVVNDPQTGLCRGFGFVEMGDGAERAVAALHGSRFHGHTLTVYESV
jgi:RNA recognition motif-containing protein